MFLCMCFFFFSFYKQAKSVSQQMRNCLCKTQTAITGTRPPLVASQYTTYILQLGTFIISFLLFHIEIEGACGWIVGGGGGRVCCPPPLENYWARSGPPAPFSCSYACEIVSAFASLSEVFVPHSVTKYSVSKSDETQIAH